MKLNDYDVRFNRNTNQWEPIDPYQPDPIIPIVPSDCNKAIVEAMQVCDAVKSVGNAVKSVGNGIFTALKVAVAIPMILYDVKVAQKSDEELKERWGTDFK